MKPRAILITCMAFSALSLAACVEEPPMTGAGLYDDHCAACHGADATGNAELGAPDLTTLTKRHGGTFPAQYAMSTIDGYSRDTTHGPMPEFGALIASPMDTWIYPTGTPTPTPVSLILLASYLEGLQQG